MIKAYQTFHDEKSGTELSEVSTFLLILCFVLRLEYLIVNEMHLAHLQVIL